MKKGNVILFGFILVTLFSSFRLYAEVDPEQLDHRDFFTDMADEFRGEPDYQDMIDQLKELISLDPENGKHYEMLAFIYDHLGDYEGMLGALQAQVKYLPDDAEGKDVIYGNLARAYILTGQPQEARTWIGKADMINPDNTYNRWHSLVVFIHADDYENAAKEMKRLSELDGSDRDAYYEAYTYALQHAGDPEKAVKLFRAAVTINPESHLAHRALAVAIRNGHFHEYKKYMPQVLRELKKALTLAPEYVPTYIAIANTYMMSAMTTKNETHFQKALAWFEKGNKIEPGNDRLAFATGYCYLQMREYDKAIEKMEFAYKEDVENEVTLKELARAYNNRAYELYQSGEDLEHGLKLIDKAIALVPGDGILLGTKAELLYKLGRYTEAHDYITQALKLAPGYAEMEQDLANIERALEEE